jgi:hypothetical protein
MGYASSHDGRKGSDWEAYRMQAKVSGVQLATYDGEGYSEVSSR